MRRETIEVLRCPITGARLTLGRVDEERGGEILAGSLAVSGHAHSFSILDGVPDLTSPVDDRDKALSIASFGKEWAEFRNWGWLESYPAEPDAELKYFGGLLAHSAGAFQAKTRCRESDIAAGNLVLDLGCGNGRFCYQAQRLGAKVIGLDASEAAYVAHRNLRERGVMNVDIVRGNALSLPFAAGTFDYAFSIGVMQHTGNPSKFLAELARVVRKEAPFSVNCYGQGLSTYEVVDRILRSVTTRIGRPRQIGFAKMMAALSRFLRSGGPVLTRFESLLFRHLMILPTFHHMYDWYTPRLAAHFSPAQLRGWLADLGAVVDDAAPPFHLDGYDDRPRRRGHGSFQFRAINRNGAESASASRQGQVESDCESGSYAEAAHRGGTR